MRAGGFDFAAVGRSRAGEWTCVVWGEGPDLAFPGGVPGEGQAARHRAVVLPCAWGQNRGMGDDPMDAPSESFPAPPLLVEERPPLRPALLEVNPTARRMENLDALRVL